MTDAAQWKAMAERLTQPQTVRLHCGPRKATMPEISTGRRPTHH